MTVFQGEGCAADKADIPLGSPLSAWTAVPGGDGAVELASSPRDRHMKKLSVIGA